jgi:hypothetical protein
MRKYLDPKIKASVLINGDGNEENKMIKIWKM